MPSAPFAFTATSLAQTPTAFTYQGRLTDAGVPRQRRFRFEFKLFNGTGAQHGTAQAREDLTVTNGVFLVRLDFLVSAFVPGAAASTLEIGVRPGASTAAHTTLAPLPGQLHGLMKRCELQGSPFFAFRLLSTMPLAEA